MTRIKSIYDQCCACYFYKDPDECHQQGPVKGGWNDYWESCSYTRLAVGVNRECGPEAKFWLAREDDKAKESSRGGS